MESGSSNDGRADDRRLFWLAHGRKRRQSTHSSDDCLGMFGDVDQICCWLIKKREINHNSYHLKIYLLH